jgi:hypothetical protein
LALIIMTHATFFSSRIMVNNGSYTSNYHFN